VAHPGREPRAASTAHTAHSAQHTQRTAHSAQRKTLRPPPGRRPRRIPPIVVYHSRPPPTTHARGGTHATSRWWSQPECARCGSTGSSPRSPSRRSGCARRLATAPPWSGACPGLVRPTPARCARAARTHTPAAGAGLQRVPGADRAAGVPRAAAAGGDRAAAAARRGRRAEPRGWCAAGLPCAPLRPRRRLQRVRCLLRSRGGGGAGGVGGGVRGGGGGAPRGGAGRRRRRRGPGGGARVRLGLPAHPAGWGGRRGVGGARPPTPPTPPSAPPARPPATTAHHRLILAACGP
jgi:hypothetical protein